MASNFGICWTAAQAFAAGRPFSRSHWTVTINAGQVQLILFGSVIATCEINASNNAVTVTTAGYNTPTTFRGVNAALRAMGQPYSVGQHKGEPVFWQHGHPPQAFPGRLNFGPHTADLAPALAGNAPHTGLAPTIGG